MPPLARAVVEIGLTKGMNQGVDRRVLPNDQWTRLVNVVMDQQGAGHKRPGYGGLPITITANSPAGSNFPRDIWWMDVRQDELVVRGQRQGSANPFNLDLDREFSWAPGLQQWSEVDYVTTASTEAEQISITTAGACLPSVAITSDGCEVWSWLIGFAPGVAFMIGPIMLARDAATGAMLRPETDLSAQAWVMQKSVAVGTIAILLGMANAGATVDAIIYAPAIDQTTLYGPLQALGRRGVWDACNVDGGRFVVVTCGPGAQQITITTYDSILVLLETNTVPTLQDVTRISVAYSPGFGFKVVYAADTAGVIDVYATHFADTPGLPQGYVTPLVAGLAAVAYVSTGVNDQGTSVALWQEVLIGGALQTPVQCQQLTNGGVFSGVRLTTANTHLRSKPFSVGHRIYALACPYQGRPAPALPAVDLFTLDLLIAPEPMATRGWATEGMFGVLSATAAYVANFGVVNVPLLPEVPRLSLTRWRLPLEKKANATARGGLQTSSSFAVGVTLDLAVQQSACPLSSENSYCTARSGAQVGWYDGEQDTELTFAHRPVFLGEVTFFSVPPALGPGPGTYLYKAVYEWIDAQGNLHQSETSDPLVVASAMTDFGVGVDVTTLGTTRKGRLSQGAERQVQIALYRTIQNGEIYFRLTPPNRGLVNNTTVAVIHHTDIVSDAALLANAYGRLYTTGGILDNRPLPGSRAVISWNNRLWSASADDGKTLWFSKLGVVGEAPGFSEGLTLRVDDAIDSVVAFGAMDDKLIVFTESRMYYVSGDGPNDTGAGGGFNGPVRIASDGGCVDARSVLSYPGGVFYGSPSGLFQIDRALQVSAKGLPVLDETTGCTYLSAWLDAPNKRMLWLVTGGTVAVYNLPRVLVYDYAFDVWSIFIPYRGVESPEPDPSLSAQVVWQGAHLWATATLVSQQGIGVTPWLDGSSYFRGFYESPWVKLSGIAGYQRAYRVTVTGKSFSDHVIHLDVLTDYDEATLVQQRGWVSTTLQNAPAVERVQLHLRCQLATAIKVRLYDSKPAIRPIGGGAIGGFDVASLAFEVGVKGGSPRLPSTNRG